MPPGYEHLQRWGTDTAMRALAVRLGLFYSQDMQDWEWQVAEVGLLPALFSLADDTALTDDERFSLAEIIIQAVDMIEGCPPDQTAEWTRARALLRARPVLHASTIWYWSSLEYAADPDMEGFRISPAMADLWREIQPDLPVKAVPV